MPNPSWPGGGPDQDHVRNCAVLPRWEERYGAVLVAIERSRLRLSVGRPSTTDAECLRYTLSRYAGMMRGARFWRD